MEVVLPSLFEWTGECPYWDIRTQELSLVDACTATGTSRIFRWNPVTNFLKSFEFNACTSFNIPTTEPQFSIVSTKNKVLKVDWTEEAPENQEHLFTVHDDLPDNRFNDAKCDKNGILISGTMSEESSVGVLKNPGSGCAFRYKNGDKCATEMARGFDLSNGIDWTSDYSKMFFVDSIARKIFVFDYDIATSTTSNLKVCIDFNKYPHDNLGLPDGVTMDSEDRLWVACFWSGKVVQFDVNTGDILQQIKLPTACTTSVCFGGAQLTDMYLTSSKFGVGNDPSKGLEYAGSLFKIPGSVHRSRGLAMNYFQL